MSKKAERAQYIGAKPTERKMLYRWIRAMIHGGYFHKTCQEKSQRNTRQ